MRLFLYTPFLIASLAMGTDAQAQRTFDVRNGQIFTPGLAIVDAPQPFTPLGGATLQVALDVSGNGRLPTWTYQALSDGTIPGSGNGEGTFYHNLTIFLSSYANGHNFTISNNSVPSIPNSYVGPVLALEPGSTVKHVTWTWPSCLRRGLGEYNISIHQSFTYNSTAYYTVFDLPILLANEISATRGATECELLNNPLNPLGGGDEGQQAPGVRPWVNGTGAVVVAEGGDGDNSGPGNDSSDGQGNSNVTTTGNGNATGDGNNDGTTGQGDLDITGSNDGQNGQGDVNITGNDPNVESPSAAGRVEAGGGFEMSWALGFVAIIMLFHHAWTFILSTNV
ncbi:hypothetical protein ABW21_db0209725 [Orbilia brochopaga]|nr:hypothetical protein ABW21_db0209725 [Drechslerella brochopaga]